MPSHGMVFLHCLTPLHNGSGVGQGVIDRPIMREKHTGYPYVMSKSVKGAVRALAEAGPQAGLVDVAFGSAKKESAAQGAAVFDDALILAMPVRSLAGTYALVTSRLALARLGRLLDLLPRAEQNPGDSADLALAIAATLKHSSKVDAVQEAAISGGDGVEGSEPGKMRIMPWEVPVDVDLGDKQTRYCLEGMVLERLRGSAASVHFGTVATLLSKILFREEYWQKAFRTRFLLVNGDVFGRLVNSATVVEANTAVSDETGAAESGSLRYSEYLPSEAILFSRLQIDPPGSAKGREEEVQRLCAEVLSKPIQLGGDESTGKGLVQPNVLWRQVGAEPQ